MNFTTVQKLIDMRNAGGAKQRIGQADKILEDLRDMLPSTEWFRVYTAISHYRTGEGREELDTVCNNLIRKYNGAPPPRTSLIAL